MSELQVLEDVLLDSYERQADLYDQATEIAARLLDGSDTIDVQSELSLLRGLMNEIGRLEGELAEVRTRWHDFAKKPGPRLGEALKKAQSKLEPLIANIQAVEQRMEEARARLVPQLNSQARSQQMQAAYSTAKETA